MNWLAFRANCMPLRGGLNEYLFAAFESIPSSRYLVAFGLWEQHEATTGYNSLKFGEIFQHPYMTRSSVPHPALNPTLSLLFVFCPCTFDSSTPLSVFLTTGTAKSFLYSVISIISGKPSSIPLSSLISQDRIESKHTGSNPTKIIICILLFCWLLPSLEQLLRKAQQLSAS